MDQQQAFRELGEYMGTPSKFSEINEYKAKCAMSAQAIEDILTEEESDTITEDEADEAILEHIGDCNIETLEIFNVDPDEFMDEEEYTAEYAAPQGNIAYFSQGISVPTILQNMLLEQYETLDDGVEAIAADSDLDPELVGQVIGGQLIPNTELIETMSSSIAAMSDDAVFADLQTLVGQTYQAAEAANAQDEEALEFEGDLINHQNHQDKAIANLARNQGNIIAQFGQIHDTEWLTNEIDGLEKKAEYLVTEGSMSPAIKTYLLGKFSARSEQVAFFSRVCSEQGVGAEQQIDRIKFAMDLVQQFPMGMGQFSQFTDEESFMPVEPLDQKTQEQVSALFAENVLTYSE